MDLFLTDFHEKKIQVSCKIYETARSFRASQVRLVSQYVSALIKNDKKSLEEFFKEYEKFLEVWA